MRRIVPVRALEIELNEANYVRSTLTESWEELPILLAGALLVTLAAAPALWLAGNRLWPPAAAAASFLLAPAWAAACYAAGRNGAGHKPYLGDLAAAFLHYYWRSSLLALPGAALVLLVLLSRPLLSIAAPLPVIAAVVFQALVALLVGLLLIHALPLLAVFDLPLRQVWPNSLLLVAGRPMVAIGLASMAVLLAFVVRRLGLAALPLVPLALVPFEVNATLMLARQAVDRQRRRDGRTDR